MEVCRQCGKIETEEHPPRRRRWNISPTQEAVSAIPHGSRHASASNDGAAAMIIGRGGGKEHGLTQRAKITGWLGGVRTHMASARAVRTGK